MSMQNVAGIICLVKDLDEVTVFYEALGFEFKKSVPGVFTTAYLNDFWIEFLLETEVVTEAFKSDVMAPVRGAGQYVHVQVEDIDEFYRTVTSKGLTPFSEPKDYPWGQREFVLVDPNGYKLVFFSKQNSTES